MHNIHSPLTALAHAGSRRLVQAASFAAALASLGPTLRDLGALDLASSEGLVCERPFDPDAYYPPLPRTEGTDLSGEAGVELHLQRHRAVVDLDGCLYGVDRPLEIDFADLEQVTLLFELHGAGAESKVFVTHTSGGVEALTVRGSTFDYTMSAEENLGFEPATPTQAAPTVPVMIAKPKDGDPPPN